MYEVILDSFTGPLDLLLHLIRKQELSIHDIPIAVVTEQYLDYLKAMEELSLDIASEFVVMAAWLLAIKSRTLLPRPPVESEDVETEDPRDELIAQLLEYERCKWAATELELRQTRSSFMMGREPMNLKPFQSVEALPVNGVSLWDLVDAYRKLLARVPKETRVAEIKGRVRTVSEMMADLLGYLRRGRVMLFRTYLGTYHSRQDVVSAFLALLELIKDQRVACTQSGPFEEIEIGLLGG